MDDMKGKTVIPFIRYCPRLTSYVIEETKNYLKCRLNKNNTISGECICTFTVFL